MRKFVLTLLVLVLLLIGLRIYLPFWVKGYVNRVLDDVEGYDGSIENVNMDLYRGAYQIEGLEMVKTGEDIPVPFLDIPLLDFSVQWSALFDGKIVGEIELTGPVINFAVGTNDTQTGAGADWTQPIKELMPLHINRFSVINGTVTYKDFTSQPQVELTLDSLQFEAANLRNTEGEPGTLPSNIRLEAVSIGGGILTITCDANLMKQTPDFDLTGEFEEVHLPDLNDFTQAYANLDFEEGVFNLYTEIVASDGQLEGYVRPVLTNLKVFSLSEDMDKPLQALWEGIVGIFTSVIQNHPRDQFATQVPFSGNLNNPDTEIWPAVGGIFRNAFIEAFSKNVENSVSFEEVINPSK